MFHPIISPKESPKQNLHKVYSTKAYIYRMKNIDDHKRETHIRHLKQYNFQFTILVLHNQIVSKSYNCFFTFSKMIFMILLQIYMYLFFHTKILNILIACTIRNPYFFWYALIFYEGFFWTSILTSSCFYVNNNIQWTSWT